MSFDITSISSVSCDLLIMLFMCTLSKKKTTCGILWWKCFSSSRFASYLVAKIALSCHFAPLDITLHGVSLFGVAPLPPVRHRDIWTLCIMFSPSLRQQRISSKVEMYMLSYWGSHRTEWREFDLYSHDRQCERHCNDEYPYHTAQCTSGASRSRPPSSRTDARAARKCVGFKRNSRNQFSLYKFSACMHSRVFPCPYHLSQERHSLFLRPGHYLSFSLYPKRQRRWSASMLLWVEFFYTAGVSLSYDTVVKCRPLKGCHWWTPTLPKKKKTFFKASSIGIYFTNIVILSVSLFFFFGDIKCWCGTIAICSRKLLHETVTTFAVFP